LKGNYSITCYPYKVHTVDKQYILDEIRRTAKQNGGIPLGRQRFFNETGIRENDWSGRYWVRWSDAVREAGYEPNTKQMAIEDTFLLRKLAELVRDLGHYPVAAELRMKARQQADFPSHNTFSRFGRKPEVAAAIVNWCETNAGWEDVEAICAEHAIDAEALEIAEDTIEVSEMGYVYLLKSGKYYKIGRSNAPGRREYELAIQLPEPAVTLHVIKTDDPVGIEKYWHQRFASYRKNGEWFELDRQCVSAFRRRKSM
jgi:hypothetical protein